MPEVLKCRACLTTEERLVPFDITSIKSYNLLTSLYVKKCDGLPQALCDLCSNKIETFVTFRLNCINSEQILKAGYESNRENHRATSKSNLEIKLDAGKTIDDDDIGADSFMGADDEPSIGGEDVLQVKYEDVAVGKMEVKEEIQTDSDLTTEPIFLELSTLLKTEKQSSVVKRGRGRPRKPDEVNPKKPQRVSKNTTAKQENKTVETKPAVKRERKSRAKYAPKVPVWLNCGLCPQKFLSKAKLAPHVETHKGETSCQICGESLPGGGCEKALSHRYNHIELKRGMLECHLCAYSYATRVAFESHYVVQHILKQTKDFACIHCFKPYPNRRQLQKHMSMHSDREFICDYCNKSYNCKSKLRMHIKYKHSKVISFQCDQCPKAFRSHNNLITHRSITHLPERIYCKTCQRHFADEQRLRNHKCKRVPKQCNICGKLIRKPGRLRVHLLVHTNERPYKCDRCPATFRGRPALKAHLNRHDNIRPYDCQHCDLKFFTRCVLKKHVAWIHTGERSYVCKVCGKGFAANHNLRVHMKVHGEYLIQSKKDQLANQNEPDTSIH